MSKALKVLIKLFLALIGFIAVTFTVYIFNLDMKLMALMEPIFLKHYDKVERDKHL